MLSQKEPVLIWTSNICTEPHPTSIAVKERIQQRLKKYNKRQH